MIKYLTKTIIEIVFELFIKIERKYFNTGISSTTDNGIIVQEFYTRYCFQVRFLDADVFHWSSNRPNFNICIQWTWYCMLSIWWPINTINSSSMKNPLINFDLNKIRKLLGKWQYRTPWSSVENPQLQANLLLENRKDMLLRRDLNPLQLFL